MRNHVVYSFFPKAVATKFTNVHDLNLKKKITYFNSNYQVFEKIIRGSYSFGKNEYTT